MAQEFRHPDIDPRHGTASSSWEVEELAAALDRAPEFGQRFLRTLFAEFPDLPSASRCLRGSNHPEQVRIVIDRADTRFNIQIDPLASRIIITGRGARAEVSSWLADQARFAVNYIRWAYMSGADAMPSTPWPANLFLIGYRGTGKSTVASLVGAQLGWEWLDLDTLLESMFGRTIWQIFADEGEEGFRDKEAAVLAEVCQRRRQVVATGGGVILRPDNRAQLKAAGKVVWLRADPDTIWQRLQADSATAARRPNLTVGGLQEIKDLLGQRESLYAASADWSVDTAEHTPEEAATLILQQVQAEAGQTK
jgi:shikimate kinase